ncbi:DUF485 domain-containing protein [Pseudarthrobacter sp. CCNWLW217]
MLQPPPVPEARTVIQQPVIPQDAFLRARESDEFRELRRTFRRFAFPMTAFFLAWYFGFVLLSVYATGFMSTPFFGNYFNIGHFLGLLQFVTTFIITGLYIRHANKRLDPIAHRIRASLEGEAH